MTGKREVNAMLDLVKQETERIESRFLEPACGTGNFLSEVLERKLNVVETRYHKNQVEYERYAVLAVSSLYGIDILEDNVIECRKRLCDIVVRRFNNIFRNAPKEEFLSSVKYILNQNIIQGDALTLKTVGEKPGPIVFPEWSPVNGNMLKRRDFAFQELLDHESTKEFPLFSDLGDDAFIPTPVREYPLVHFLRIANAKEK